ncbi:MAG: hypothetical protein AAFR47_02175 [Pseudomonadota bacterium]
MLTSSLFLLVLAATPVMLPVAEQARACLAPDLEDHHFPTCTILEPGSADLVTIIDAKGTYLSASHHVEEPGRATNVATLTIAPSDRSHYLVL